MLIQWGMPQKMKFDNGAPFGMPARNSLSLMSLLLVGLGIEVHYIRPGRPTDNSRVERMQGVSAKWADASKADNTAILQQRLDWVCQFQRETYPTRTCSGKTRVETYPQLSNNQRIFCPASFDWTKVQLFVQQHSWKRKIASNGRIRFHNKGFQVGKAYARQWLLIRYEGSTHQWQFFNVKGEFIRAHPAHFNTQSICELSAFKERENISK